MAASREDISEQQREFEEKSWDTSICFLVIAKAIHESRNTLAKKLKSLSKESDELNKSPNREGPGLTRKDNVTQKCLAIRPAISAMDDFLDAKTDAAMYDYWKTFNSFSTAPDKPGKDIPKNRILDTLLGVLNKRYETVRSEKPFNDPSVTTKIFRSALIEIYEAIAKHQQFHISDEAKDLREISNKIKKYAEKHHGLLRDTFDENKALIAYEVHRLLEDAITNHSSEKTIQTIKGLIETQQNNLKHLKQVFGKQDSGELDKYLKECITRMDDYLVDYRMQELNARDKKATPPAQSSADIAKGIASAQGGSGDAKTIMAAPHSAGPATDVKNESGYKEIKKSCDDIKTTLDGYKKLLDDFKDENRYVKTAISESKILIKEFEDKYTEITEDKSSFETKIEALKNLKSFMDETIYAIQSDLSSQISDHDISDISATLLAMRTLVNPKLSVGVDPRNVGKPGEAEEYEPIPKSRPAPGPGS